MSELQALRDLPPVEPVDPPGRFSATFVKHFDRCPRAAYLYRKHRGGAASHPLNGGSLYHLAVARCIQEMVDRDEPEIDSDSAKELLDATIDEHPELPVPLAAYDDLRMMMWHFATGFRWQGRVVATERKFNLDLGLRFTGIVDFAVVDGDTLEVRDHKTSFHIPAQDEFEAGVQLPFYAILAAFGHPVRIEPCNVCSGSGLMTATPDGQVPLTKQPGAVWYADGYPRELELVEKTCVGCQGRGSLDIPEEPIGHGINHFRLSEWYPRYKRDDGQMQHRTRVLTRAELFDLQHDLGRLGVRIREAFDSGLFPAVPGSHCSECPAHTECPLPARLRDFQGEIDTEDRARVAAEKWLFLTSEAARLKREIRNFAKNNGPRHIRLGRDLVLEFKQESRRDTDWEGLRLAAHVGEEFDPEEFVRERPSSKFEKRKLKPAEVAAFDEREQREKVVLDAEHEPEAA